MGWAVGHPPPLTDADGPSEGITSTKDQRLLHLGIPWSAPELAPQGLGGELTLPGTSPEKPEVVTALVDLGGLSPSGVELTLRKEALPCPSTWPAFPVTSGLCFCASLQGFRTPWYSSDCPRKPLFLIEKEPDLCS